jgi:hypothetical protein
MTREEAIKKFGKLNAPAHYPALFSENEYVHSFTKDPVTAHLYASKAARDYLRKLHRLFVSEVKTR